MLNIEMTTLFTNLPDVYFLSFVVFAGNFLVMKTTDFKGFLIRNVFIVIL